MCTLELDSSHTYIKSLSPHFNFILVWFFYNPQLKIMYSNAMTPHDGWTLPPILVIVPCRNFPFPHYPLQSFHILVFYNLSELCCQFPPVFILVLSYIHHIFYHIIYIPSLIFTLLNPPQIDEAYRKEKSIGSDSGTNYTYITDSYIKCQKQEWPHTLMVSTHVWHFSCYITSYCFNISM